MKRYVMKVSLTFLSSIVILLLLCRSNLSSELFIEQIKHLVIKPINSLVLQDDESETMCVGDSDHNLSDDLLNQFYEPSTSTYEDQYLELINDTNAEGNPGDDEKLPEPLSIETAMY